VCPNCKYKNYKSKGCNNSEDGSKTESFECYSCGCEWTWFCERTIDFQGKPSVKCICKNDRKVTLIKGNYYVCDFCGGLINVNH
jgi:hypothetical protein